MGGTSAECFLWLPAPLKPRNIAAGVRKPGSCLPPGQEQPVLYVLQPNQEGTTAATAASRRLHSLPSCQDSGCPLVLGLDPVVPSSDSPVTDTRGHTITEHLPCARHSLHMGEQGSCMIPTLSELLAQLVIAPPQSCWPVIYCLLQTGAHEAGGL